MMNIVHNIVVENPDLLKRVAEILLAVKSSIGYDHHGTIGETIVEQNDREDIVALTWIRRCKIADIKANPTNNHARVLVSNHYRLDASLVEIYKHTRYDWLKEYADISNLPNVAVYDPNAGVGIINGKKIDFRRKQDKRNKKLFDALFLAAEMGVDRDTLKKIIKAKDMTNTQSAYYISEAFTKLRKICGVNKDVIELNDSGRLRAKLYRPDFGLLEKLLRR